MIRFNDPDDGKAIADGATACYNPVGDACIAAHRGGKLLGGVIYQGYTGASIQAHIASFDPHWLTRDMLWMIFHYPFEQLGVKKIFGQVGAHNAKALEFDRKLGFKEEARIADVYPEGDMVLLSMHKADCRFLSIKPRHIEVSYGQEQSAEAA